MAVEVEEFCEELGLKFVQDYRKGECTFIRELPNGDEEACTPDFNSPTEAYVYVQKNLDKLRKDLTSKRYVVAVEYSYEDKDHGGWHFHIEDMQGRDLIDREVGLMKDDGAKRVLIMTPEEALNQSSEFSYLASQLSDKAQEVEDADKGQNTEG